MVPETPLFWRINPHGFPHFKKHHFFKGFLGTKILSGIFQGYLPNFTEKAQVRSCKVCRSIFAYTTVTVVTKRVPSAKALTMRPSRLPCTYMIYFDPNKKNWRNENNARCHVSWKVTQSSIDAADGSLIAPIDFRHLFGRFSCHVSTPVSAKGKASLSPCPSWVSCTEHGKTLLVREKCFMLEMTLTNKKMRPDLEMLAFTPSLRRSDNTSLRNKLKTCT